jgi:hypothetical protein
MLRRSLACAAVLVTAACSSTPPTGSGGGGGAPSGADEAHYTFSFTTAPGQETHWCQYMKMPERESGDVLVTGYRWSWQNMHHWALYRTTKDLPANVSLNEPFDCFAPGAMKYAAPASLQLGAGATGDQSFPEGTGFGFEPGEIVVFQAHTLNTSSADLHPTIDLTVKLGDPAKTPNRLGLIQFYDPYIYVPAHTQARAQMRCAIPQDLTIVQATTHEHIRGTGVSVFLDAPDGTLGQKPLLQSSDWEHPSTSNDILQVAKGSHIRTVCDYLGDAHDVIQGQDKQDNEMCMYIAYYYPAITDGGLFENCVQTPIPGGVGDGYGTGAKSCADTLTCIQSCPPGDAPNPGDGRIDVGACWQRCLVDSCEKAAAPLNALSFCVQNECAAECSGGDCASCVIQNCASEYGACQSQGC